MPEEIAIIRCDPKLIEQVLLNLLENAAVHGKSTTHILVSFRLDGGKAVFSVSDDGCGIDEEVIPKLFEDYVDRIDDGARKRSEAEHGNRLAVCRTIIKAHGGEIKAYKHAI